MIKTVKKEFDCSNCDQPSVDLAVIESKDAGKDICWHCAYQVKRHNHYFNSGLAETFYQEVAQ